MSRKSISGFTIIELMLAMTFISVLLVGVAMTTIQISNIYTKGITLKSVNQAGRGVSEDVQRNISASAPFELSGANTQHISDRPGGGRLCLGRYTYAWNYGVALRDNAPYNVYDSSSEPIRFIRVSDPGSTYCANPNSQIAYGSGDNRPIELLAEGDLNLAVHQFTINSNVQTAQNNRISQQLYRVSFTIGTNEQATLATGDTQCKPPDSDADGLGGMYCAVNRFEITARAGNLVIGG